MTERPADRTRALRPLIALAIVALAAAACRTPQAANDWAALDAGERHPIIVTREPAKLTLKVPRGSSGLNGQQRLQAMDFLARYRTADAGNSKLVIEVPHGTANEISAMQAAAQLRDLVQLAGFDPASVAVETFAERAGTQPPVRLSYLRFVVEAPECGSWPTNLAENRNNVPYPNFGCATQRNLAMQVANPADLVGPRAMTPRSGERRHDGWEKYVKGTSTVAQKQADEKVKE